MKTQTTKEKKAHRATICVFDTETTGLPPYEWDPISKKRVISSPEKINKWTGCRVVQVAWSVHDQATGDLIEKSCHFIKPCDFIVTPESTAIHGISHEEAMQKGEDVDIVWEHFIKVVRKCNVLVAHNIDFDVHVAQAELHRLGKAEEANDIKEKPAMCTMKAGTLPGKKWPRLAELYERCFHEKPEISHKADADVEQCAAIYFHMNMQKYE